MWEALALIFFVIIFIVIALVIWRYPTLFDKSQFGTWSTLQEGICQGQNGHCNTSGTSSKVEICTPNSRTGYGCLLSDNSLGLDNQQVFGIRITNTSCTPGCRSAIWQDITPSDQVCYADTITPQDTTSCVLKDTPGYLSRTLQCVAWDTTGPNLCTNVNIPNLDQFQQFPAVEIYQPGQTISFQELCSNYTNPICGNWNFQNVMFQPSGTKSLCQPPEPVNGNGCSFNPFLQIQSGCQTQGTNGYDTLIEGYFLSPMSCSYPNSSCSLDTATVTPLPTDSAISSQCQLLDPTRNPPCQDNPIWNCNQISCYNTPVTSSEVINGTIPPNTVNFAVSCPGVASDNSANPQCLSVCRKYPGPLLNIPWDPLLNQILIFRVPQIGYLSAFSTPPPTNSTIIPELFQDLLASPVEPLKSVNLVVVPDNWIQRYAGCPLPGFIPNCDLGCLQLNTAIWMILGPRNYNSSNSQLLCQMMGTIGNTYLGWIQNNPINNLNMWQWVQAYDQYTDNSSQQIGINSTQAGTFQFTLLNYTTDNLPELTGIKGIATIQLPYALTILNIHTNNNITVNQLEIYVFDPSLNPISRGNRQTNNCNLQFCPVNPNPNIVQPIPVLPRCPTV